MSIIHPILTCAASLRGALDEVAEVDPMFIATDDKADALATLADVAGQLAELQLRVMASADDVAELHGARDVAAWLAHTQRLDPRSTRSDQRLARALDERYHLLRLALRGGQVNLGQARVIAKALDELPDEVDRGIRLLAEKHLIAEAGHFGPRELERLGKRVLEVVAPDVAEEHDRKQLEAEERTARRRTTLKMVPLGDGTTSLKARIPDAAAGRLKTCLEAFTSPRKQVRERLERLSYPMRQGRAFCSLLESLDPDRLPLHGGRATTVVVTLSLETLLGGLGTATTDNGHDISAGEARRLACTAGIVPAVLGSRSEVLDLGRSSRLFSRVQRLAMAARDKTCRAEGCDIPAAWTEAHHLRPWSRGGKTNLADGVLLCSHHHHRAHDDRLSHERLPNGDVRFHRRT